MLGSPRRWRREEVARAAGVSLEDARRLWRAMGFADVGDAVAFTDEDIGALRLLVTLLDRGVLDRTIAVDVARSLGQTTSRLADWQVDIVGRQLVERGVLDPGDPLAPRSADGLSQEMAVLLPALEKLLVHGWRRQLAAALERGLGDAEASGEVETGHLTVGFADQVGFTRLDPAHGGARARGPRRAVRVALGRHRRGRRRAADQDPRRRDPVRGRPTRWPPPRRASGC